MRPRSVLLAVAAGLALADASVVTLALPELLVQLDTTVEGVASVIGVYTVVLASALIGVERLSRRIGPERLGLYGFTLFAAASVVCGASGALPLLLTARALQALGGAAGLICAFELLHGERESPRHLWLGAAVMSAAVGPALGGALTEAFNWRAIFYAQAPITAAAAVLCGTLVRRGSSVGVPQADHSHDPHDSGGVAIWRSQVALALVSAALTAVLFLLVLLLVAGWAVNPLKAAATVTIVPAGALIGARLPGDARWRAAAGCLLVGLGTIALAYLPNARVAWTFAPQALAGLGMGLALPALAGELLPERDARDAARLLTMRHVGIALALAILAPVTSARLEDSTRHARQEGVALVMDAKLDPRDKLGLAPALLGTVDETQPRRGLRDALSAHRSDLGEQALPEYDRMGVRADDVLVGAVGDSFFPAFWITGAFAMAAGIALLTRGRVPRWAPATLAAGVLVIAVQVVAWDREKPAEVQIADPCNGRDLPETGGVTGFLQDRAIQLLDATACRLGSSREELVLAFADPAEAKEFQKRHGTDPRNAGALLSTVLGG